MSVQLQSGQSLSSASREQLAVWRTFLEASFAVMDILDAELQAERGITLRWYDVLVHLEEVDGGIRMKDVASRILSSKSGLTRTIDRMEEAGLVERRRPPDDRRVIEIVITRGGREALEKARVVHRRGINEHFAQHLNQKDLTSLARAMEKVRAHVRPLRPGRISG